MEERDNVSARMPPHQPVPMTATSTCCTLLSPALLSISIADASGLVRAHAAVFDHLGPLGGLGVHIDLEVLRRLAADGERAALAHARLNFGICEHLDDGGVQLVDDRPRRARGHQHALPGRSHEVFPSELVHGGYI